jgi:ribosomal protein S18 acetylase RimI-like enzyme
MQFELTEALIDDILFAMEDQGGEFLLDTVEGVVSGGPGGLDFSGEETDDGEGGERYIDLPEWDSADGFRLMERFAAGFRNPLLREELSSALDLGKGVFRAFKDVLGRYPEAEKLWFSFKEKAMKREIWRWYNGLREEWGLEKIGVEPEDTDDLVLEDFSFRPFEEKDRFQAEDLHRQCVQEFGENLAETGSSPDGSSSDAEIISRELYSFRDNPGSSFGMIVESLGGDFAGYISGAVKDTALYIQSLEVKPKYRGLGLGEALLVRFINSLDPAKIKKVMMDLPSRTDGFSRVLLRESFKPYAARYWRTLH